ncbi:MAG: TetR/AcrR family transcriptional regulator [Ilumatobacter sp.]|uniref:TetR/AcrR family transcriptional regulator n=1 Tax=Ilumatobacter sp. TaxID=1967498 RepID=UPI003C713E46
MSKIVDVDQRRLELARATANVIARRGVAGASMREVAAEAGWTTGTLAHYFTNKRELLAFTLENSLEQRRDKRAERTDLESTDPLRAMLSVALPADDEGRLHWTVTVAFAAHAASDDQLQRVQRDAYRSFRSHLVALLLEDAAITLDGAIIEAERLIALVDGIALQALFDPETWPPERQYDALEAGLVAQATAVRA